MVICRKSFLLDEPRPGSWWRPPATRAIQKCVYVHDFTEMLLRTLFQLIHRVSPTNCFYSSGARTTTGAGADALLCIRFALHCFSAPIILSVSHTTTYSLFTAIFLFPFVPLFCVPLPYMQTRIFLSVDDIRCYNKCDRERERRKRPARPIKSCFYIHIISNGGCL